jgi:hypothetical protein
MSESEYKMKKTSEKSHLSKAPKKIKDRLIEMKKEVANMTYSFTDDNNKTTYFAPDVVVRIDKTAESYFNKLSHLMKKLNCDEKEAREFLNEMNDIK